MHVQHVMGTCVGFYTAQNVCDAGSFLRNTKMVMIQCFTEHKTVMQALRNTKMFVTVQCFTESKTGAGFTEHKKCL